ncbi:MAG: sensor histidine kinase [Gammaproteobacteria bacterium]
MKVVLPALTELAVPRLGLAAFHNRLVLRATFVLLMLATLALAIVLLHEEKQRSYQNYQRSFSKTQAEIMAKLRHPSGLLALLNPSAGNFSTPLHPLMLPYGSLDFDDRYKARQAVEMSGCSVLYPNGSSICVAIGNNPYAGGFIYLVGSFLSTELVSRKPGMLQLDGVHRARVNLRMRGKQWLWVAPFEAQNAPKATAQHGRLTGFVETGELLKGNAMPVRDFRGWLWQSRHCAGAVSDTPNCPKLAYFSIRLPVGPLRDALFQGHRPVWPPADLENIHLSMQVLAPHNTQPLFDSDTPSALPPFSLNDLQTILQPGETLSVSKLEQTPQQLLTIKGKQAVETSSPWLTRLIHRLPIPAISEKLELRDVITTAVGRYEMRLTGQLRSLDRSLSIAATRTSGFVAAMLAAIVLAWMVIEFSFVRRVAVLTNRAATVSHTLQEGQFEQQFDKLDFADLRGRDELGILAGSLADLLQRVKNDIQREHIRTQQEREMWHAVGHEIMSPLQSLMVLHSSSDDASHRYVQRMQQAVRVLYGSASPSEALEAVTLQIDTLDINRFLQNVADNAYFAGVLNVQFRADSVSNTQVHADEFSLEDVITHILRNADRHRIPGTFIQINLKVIDNIAHIGIHNQGHFISPVLLDKIFEYGISGTALNGRERRGQGLFVARTYMAKMGGTIRAENQNDGVAFVLTLQCAV